MTIVLTAVGVTLFAFWVCALSEAALNCVSEAQVERCKRHSAVSARWLHTLCTRRDEPLTTLRGVEILLVAFGSAGSVAMVTQQSQSLYFGAIAGVLIGLVFVLVDLSAKRIGAASAERVALRLAGPTMVLTKVCWPFTYYCRAMHSRLIRGWLGRPPTGEEAALLDRLSEQPESLRPQAVRWVENALDLERVKAHELMTPRTVVYRLPADLPLSKVTERSEHWSHSRLPLTEDRNPDHIIGMVYRREVFDAIVRGDRARTLRDLMHPIDFVPEMMRGHQLLDKFITEKKHMACVLNEYGDFEGVVTLEDVLECLLGVNIVDETDRYADMQQLARRRAEQRNLLAEDRVYGPANSSPPVQEPLAASVGSPGGTGART